MSKNKCNNKHPSAVVVTDHMHPKSLYCFIGGDGDTYDHSLQLH